MVGWLGSALFALVLLFLFSTVRIRFRYYRQGENDEVTVQFRMWAGLLRFQTRFPTIRLTAKGWNVKESTGKKPPWHRRIRWKTLRRAQREFTLLQQRVVDLYEVMRRFMAHVTCDRFIWKSGIGTGDAAETGVLAGLAWGVKTGLVAVFGSYIRWRARPHLDIVPHFQEHRLETELDCIIRFRLGHAILAMIRVLTRMRAKGGEGTWQNTPFKA
jgi:hypothetical protein